MIDMFRKTLLTLLTTGNTAALTLMIILMLFGVLAGLSAALLIYWMDQRPQRPQGTAGETCLRHTRRLRHKMARRPHSSNTPTRDDEYIVTRSTLSIKQCIMKSPSNQDVSEEGKNNVPCILSLLPRWALYQAVHTVRPS